MALREKYNHAIQTAKSLRFDGSAQEQNGKLHFKGTADSQEDANKIWNAIKTVPDWQDDIVADIKVNPSAQKTAGTTGQSKTYTVKAGDTFSKIAKEQLGDANAYQEISWPPVDPLVFQTSDPPLKAARCRRSVLARGGADGSATCN